MRRLAHVIKSLVCDTYILVVCFLFLTALAVLFLKDSFSFNLAEGLALSCPWFLLEVVELICFDVIREYVLHSMLSLCHLECVLVQIKFDYTTSILNFLIFIDI